MAVYLSADLLLQLWIFRKNNWRLDHLVGYTQRQSGKLTLVKYLLLVLLDQLAVEHLRLFDVLLQYVHGLCDPLSGASLDRALAR